MTTNNVLPPNQEQFRIFLKKHQLKATPQRLAVHDAMLSLGHASADMVADHIEKKNEVSVTVASVYNILYSLADLGLYTHRLSSNSKMYFDVNSFEHSHIYDTVNNVYKDYIDDELTALVHEKLKGKKFKGYKIDGIDIQILCHPTRSRAKKI